MKIALCIIIVLFALCSFAQSKCPSRKVNRKNQLSRIKTMNENVIVVEATYLGKQESLYTFEIETVWAKHNGSLERHATITVATSGSAVEECLEELGHNNNYILMLTPLDENTFTTIEPPVPSDRRRGKHRKVIWEKLCARLNGEEDTCKTRVTLTPSKVIYLGSSHIMECKVESSTPFRSVEWYKDGKVLGSLAHRKAGYLFITDGSTVAVIIQHANHIHNGKYSCTATSEDGQVAKGYTSLRVVGPRKPSEQQCPVDTYCVNGGLCHQEGNRSYCECPSEYTGPRCENIYFDILAVGGKSAELESKVSQLTIAIVLVAVAFVGVLFFGSIYVFQLRKKASQKKGQYLAVEQSNTTFDQTIERPATLLINGGTEATSSRLSAIVISDAPNSRRASALAVNATPNGSKREHLTPRVSISSSHYEFNTQKSLSSNSISRPNSAASERSFRRERLNAKSL